MITQNSSKKGIRQTGIQIEEHAGVSRKGEVVQFGVPFAEGEWPEGTPMSLECDSGNSSGKVDALHWDTALCRPDGSVRLAFCSVSITINAQSCMRLTPVPRSPRADLGVLNASSVISSITCSTSISDAHKIEDHNSAGNRSRKTDGGGECVRLKEEKALPGRSRLKPQRMCMNALEVAGTVRALGQEDYIFRLIIRNVSTHTLNLAQLRYTIDAGSLLEDEGDSIKMQLGFCSDRVDGMSNPQYLQLTRIGRLTASGRKPVRIQYPLGGECRQNYIWVRAYGNSEGITAAVRNLGENFPCKLSLDPDHNRIMIDIWPDEAGPLNLAPGMSKTHEIGVVRDDGGEGGGGVPEAQKIHFPLVPAVPWERMTLLACFPDFSSYLPEKYPKIEFWTKWCMANRPRGYGFLHFGDEPSFSYLERTLDQSGIFWLNNEYDYPLIALTEFCRTGERLWYEDGRAAVMHMMDIDTCAVNEDPLLAGGQYSHSPEHITHPPAPDHEWLEGLLLWYVLSADERAFQYARALADRLCRLADSGVFDKAGMTSRRYGWPLIALCSFHAFTGEMHYIESAGRIVEGMKRVENKAGGLRSPYWNTPYWSYDTFMLGIAAAALSRYHRITGDRNVEKMIVRACDSIVSMASPEGILYYKEYPMVRLPEPYASSICLEALAYGYKLTNNRDYLVVGAWNLEMLIENSRSGLMIHWNAEERRDFEGGAYMRARIEEITGQYIGIMHRGIWPFLKVAEEAGLYEGRHNPFGFTVQKDSI